MARPWRTLLLSATLLAPLFTLGLGGQATPLAPGGSLGTTRLARGTAATADLKLFDVCDPVILRNGRYDRRCGVVPRVRRLFVGYGVFEPHTEIDTVWGGLTWAAWLDGRRVLLSSFGTSDRPLLRFGPAGGKDVTLREWRVLLVRPSPGRHRIRYRMRGPATFVDATWTFTIAVQ